MGDIVSNIKTIDDYTRAKAASDQALQSGQLDALNKKNIYATQVLSAAAATGNQNAYDVAKKHLSDNGIDISTWAPDVQTGVTQANAARLAQSPLGSLLNAGLKQQSNDIALSGLTGQLPMQGLNIGGVPINISGMPQSKPVNQQNINPNVIANPWKNPDNVNSQASISTPDLIQGQTAPQTSLQSPQLNVQGGFTPPRQMPGETLKAYNDRVNMAFQQYKETPQAVRQNEAAKDQGKIDVANTEASNKAQELTDRLTKNLQGMLALNNSVPQSGFVPSSTKAYLSRALQANPALSNIGLDTSGDAAKSFAQWNQINNQQVLSEIQQFVASGGANTRVNQTLEKIAKMASSISPDEAPATRQAEIQNALAELTNKNISGQNLVRDNQAQPGQPYTDIPVTVPSGSEKAVQKLDLYNKSKAQFDNKRKPVIDASEYFK